MARSAKCLVALLVLLPLFQEVAADTPALVPDYGGVVLHIPSADGDPTSYSREGHRLVLDAELISVARTTSLSAGIRRNKQRSPAVMTFVHNGVTAQHWAWNDSWQIGLRMIGAGEQRGPELATHDVVGFRRQDLARHLDKIRNGERGRTLTQADPAWQRPIGRGWSIAIAGNTGLVAGPAPTNSDQDYLAAPGHLEGFSLEDGASQFKIPIDRTIVQDGLAVGSHGIVLTLVDESVVYVGP